LAEGWWEEQWHAQGRSLSKGEGGIVGNIQEGKIKVKMGTEGKIKKD
jgi:hypothetical protein